MKNTIFFALVLFFFASGVLQAQPYTIAVTLIQGTNNDYDCKISSGLAWTHGDLVTWIFPDGQMLQKEIVVNGNTFTNDAVVWSPSEQNVDVNKIKAFVARKGGTGDPSNITIPGNSVLPSGNSTSPPVKIDFLPGKSWKASYTWEFAPGKHNFLVISYTKGTCLDSLAQFEIVLPAGVIMRDTLSFKSEYMSTDANNNIIIGVEPKANACNFLLKLRLDDTVTIGRVLNIRIRSSLCQRGLEGKSSINQEFETLPFVAKGEPHDPNYKSVDVKKIAKGKGSPVKLIYTIQFHNDGEAPVSMVTVIDTLPQELDPSTFKLVDTPQMNGLQFSGFTTDPLDTFIKKMVFEAVPNFPGLPGLNQAHPSHCFDETIYRFSFEVKTKADIQTSIENKAAVYFHLNDTTQLPVVITGIARVEMDDKIPDPPKAPCGSDHICICLCKCSCWIWGLLVLLLLLLVFWFCRRRWPRHYVVEGEGGAPKT